MWIDDELALYWNQWKIWCRSQPTSSLPSSPKLHAGGCPCLQLCLQVQTNGCIPARQDKSDARRIWLASVNSQNTPAERMIDMAIQETCTRTQGARCLPPLTHINHPLNIWGQHFKNIPHDALFRVLEDLWHKNCPSLFWSLLLSYNAWCLCRDQCPSSWTRWWPWMCTGPSHDVVQCDSSCQFWRCLAMAILPVLQQPI